MLGCFKHWFSLRELLRDSQFEYILLATFWPIRIQIQEVKKAEVTIKEQKKGFFKNMKHFVAV